MKMKKIVINNCYGGVGLSQEALMELQKLDDKLVIIKLELVRCSLTDDTAMLHRETLWLAEDLLGCSPFRANLNLVEVVEKLGSRVNNDHSELKIVEIPDDVEYKIDAYDGQEWVAEAHRTWSYNNHLIEDNE